MNSFKVNDTQMMSNKCQIYNSDTQATTNYLLILQSMYGHACTHNVHIIAKYSAINSSIQKQNDNFNTSHIGIPFTNYQKKDLILELY